MKLLHSPAGPEIDLLPSGALDPKNPRYIPEDLRADFVNISAEEENKMRRRLRGVTPPAHTIAGKLVTLDPASDADFETLVVWEKLTLVRTQRRSRQAQAEQAARDAVTFKCSACDEVRVDLLDGTHTRDRTLPDKLNVKVCERCFTVLEGLAIARLAGQRLPNGMTRGEACAVLYESSRP